LLIYLGSYLQSKLMPLLHYPPRPLGYPFLGPSESITFHGELFKPIDSKHRISQRKNTTVSTNAAKVFGRGITKVVAGDVAKPDASVDAGELGKWPRFGYKVSTCRLTCRGRFESVRHQNHSAH